MSKSKDQLEDQIGRIERKIDCKEEKKERINEKIDSEICELKKEISKIRTKLWALETARQKRCKHNGEIGKRSNSRDDASFEYWLFCRKCKLDVGHQNHDGTIEYNVPIGVKK